MAVVAIVQARMGSERLPGKVLLDIAGKSMLAHVVHRLQRANLIDRVVVATTTADADEQIVAECEQISVLSIRGSEEDVLGRYQMAALAFDADAIVRVSADSPFVDPEVCDLVVSRFLAAEPAVDYASNKIEPSFPLGLDVEVFTREALTRTAMEAVEPFERAHVTVYMYQHPERFSLLAVGADRDLHSWRWTVDTAEDLAFARAVFGRLGGDFSWHDAVALIEKDPSLAEINAHVIAKPVTDG